MRQQKSSLFWFSFIVDSRSSVTRYEPKMVLFVPNCRLPDFQDFRVILTVFLCFFFTVATNSANLPHTERLVLARGHDVLRSHRRRYAVLPFLHSNREDSPGRIIAATVDRSKFDEHELKSTFQRVYFPSTCILDFQKRNIRLTMTSTHLLTFIFGSDTRVSSVRATIFRAGIHS